jgi:hypothetical protein
VAPRRGVQEGLAQRMNFVASPGPSSAVEVGEGEGRHASLELAPNGLAGVVASQDGGGGPCRRRSGYHTQCP